AAACAGVEGPRRTAAWARVCGESGPTDFRKDDLRDRLRSFLDNGPSYDFHMGGFQAGMDVWRKQHGDGSRDIAGFYLGYGRATADVHAVLAEREAGTASM
ncbi:autotransporter domain-containing protein, partial [Rhizobiaceae sp. 2RAB30]